MKPASHNYINKISVVVISLLLFCSCKKFIEVQPPSTSLTADAMYASNATAVSVLTGMYTTLSNAGLSGPGYIESLTLYAGLSADEFKLWGGITNNVTLAYYRNLLNQSGTGFSAGAEYWPRLYTLIFKCNDALEGISASQNLTPAVKQQLLGEARFLRALFYFYLINLYGEVPLALTTDYTVNSRIVRSGTDAVYQQIIADLHEAQHLLSSNYLDGALLNPVSDRVRPTKWVATALLARAYLYAKNWAGADSASSALIDNTTTFSLSTLDKVFLRSNMDNKEAIWQLQPVSVDGNTPDAVLFILPATGLGFVHPVQISPSLLNSFETGDKRRENWIDSVVVAGTAFYFPFKYKISPLITPGAPVTEHIMLFRLAEQYLIRAEAKAQQNDMDGAKADLDMIRTRAGLDPTSASTQPELLSAILHERQVEFFTELGHRWFDLKRTATIDAVMGTGGACADKGGTWKSYQQLYPLPSADVLLNPNLTQNPQY